jgi:hypothetical protein
MAMAIGAIGEGSRSAPPPICLATARIGDRRGGSADVAGDVGAEAMRKCNDQRQLGNRSWRSSRSASGSGLRAFGNFTRLPAAGFGLQATSAVGFKSPGFGIGCATAGP